jgi:Yip1 domain
MANGTADSIAPYFTIWTEPRATIRRIVDIDPRRSVIILAMLAPVLTTLERQWIGVMSGGKTAPWWPFQVALEVVGAAIFGILALYVNSGLVTWAGRAIGGVGRAIEMRAAIAWSEIPTITAAGASIIALLLGLLTPPEVGINGLPKMGEPLIKLGGVHFVLGVWGFVLSVKCISEVHKFSAWRALLAVLIVAAIALAILSLIIFASYLSGGSS